MLIDEARKNLRKRVRAVREELVDQRVQLFGGSGAQRVPCRFFALGQQLGGMGRFEVIDGFVVHTLPRVEFVKERWLARGDVRDHAPALPQPTRCGVFGLGLGAASAAGRGAIIFMITR